MSEDILSRAPTKADSRIPYGPSPENFVDFRFPKGDGPFPVLLVIHGGFWRAAYDLSHMSHLCSAITGTGVITCNVEYRKVGQEGGGWPGTFLDVASAEGLVDEVGSKDTRFDREKTVALGFSAGGHLALWLSNRHKIEKNSDLTGEMVGRIHGAVSIAGVSDLRTAWERKVGGNAVADLMGGSPEERPERYDIGSPVELLPAGVRQTLIHGTADEVVPCWQSEDYERRAKRLGDDPNLVVLEGVGHFDPVDPKSVTWRSVSSEIIKILGNR